MAEGIGKPRGRAFDYGKARSLLNAAFDEAETWDTGERRPALGDDLDAAADTVFESATQAFREVLLGCCLARLVDPDCDVRLPYVNQGERAFNGRTLDEQVVNPVLHERSIPCSKGPYLNVFRRSVRFVPEQAEGKRDRAAYDAFLAWIGSIGIAGAERLAGLLEALCFRFLVLRDAARIELVRVNRLSLPQFESFIGALVSRPSGGLTPVLVSVGVLRAIGEVNRLDWTVDWQGINVADKASGVGGDITVRSGDTVVFAAEVTEREIDRSRVESTFRTKIAVHSLTQYVFLHTKDAPTADARAAAERFHAQGHDVVFFSIVPWATTVVGTFGPGFRAACFNILHALFGGAEVPARVKVAWNDSIQEAIR